MIDSILNHPDSCTCERCEEWARHHARLNFCDFFPRTIEVQNLATIKFYALWYGSDDERVREIIDPRGGDDFLAKIDAILTETSSG